jgi:hypothetical protein
MLGSEAIIFYAMFSGEKKSEDELEDQESQYGSPKDLRNQAVKSLIQRKLTTSTAKDPSMEVNLTLKNLGSLRLVGY